MSTGGLNNENVSPTDMPPFLFGNAVARLHLTKWINFIYYSFINQFEQLLYLIIVNKGRTINDVGEGGLGQRISDDYFS